MAVLGRVLLASGKLDKAALQKALKNAPGNRKSLIAELVDSGAMRPLDVAQVLAQAFAAPLLDLSAIHLAALPDKLLDEVICREYQLLVLGKRKHALVIATADLLIGITALHYGYALGTRNVRHFKMIPGLKVVPL